MTHGDGHPAGAAVWIVEDHAETAAALGRLLGRRGYAPRTFGRASDVLAAIDALATGGPAPRAAVVDVHLPDLNGLVLVDRLRRAFGPGLPILVLSGDTSMGTLNSLPHVGATHFLGKPVNAAALLELLGEHLGRDGGVKIAGG